MDDPVALSDGSGRHTHDQSGRTELTQIVLQRSRAVRASSAAACLAARELRQASVELRESIAWQRAEQARLAALPDDYWLRGWRSVQDC